MSALDTSVKYFTSAMTGAASLSNGAGNLISVLDACLVNGFGSVTLDSLVIASGIGTATKASGHSAIASAVVTISGVTGALSGINGQHKVITITSTTVVFDAYGIADGTAAGTITLALAGAGWTKAYSGTNLAAYKSSNAAASGSVLRVNDAGTTIARVNGYTSMTDVNTGQNIFPNATQLSGGLYWPKSNTTGSRPWWIVANDRFLYLGVAPYATYPGAFAILGFGDLVSLRASDAYRAALFGQTSDQSAAYQTTAMQPITYIGGGANCAGYLPRAYSGIGAPVTCLPLWFANGNASGNTGLIFPNGADNALVYAAIYMVESSALRGLLPGGFATPLNVQASIADGTILDAVSPFGRSALYRQYGHTSTATIGGMFFDLTGPWGT